MNPTQTMTVTVTLPGWLWWRVAKLAEKRNIPVAGFIADAIREKVDLNARHEKRLDQFGVLQSELRAARREGFLTPHSSHVDRRPTTVGGFAKGLTGDVTASSDSRAPQPAKASEKAQGRNAA